MAIETAVVTGTTPTSTGTQSFESSGFGTPQAAIIFLSRANTTNNPQADAAMSHGFTDGTREVYSTFEARDAQGTTSTRRRMNNNALCYIEQAASARCVGAFSAWATDGLTINFTTVDTVAYNISVLLIKGCTNVYADAVSLTTTGVNDITAPGFKGNLLFTGCIGNASLGGTTNSMYSFGAAHNNSSDVVTEGQAAVTSVTGGASEVAAVVTRDDSCTGQLFNDAQSWQGSAQDFDSSGFSINTGATNPGNDFMMYLILDTGDTDGVDVSIVDSPTATGTWNVTDPGFEPQSVILGLTSTATTNTIITADPVTFGLSMFDDTSEFCYGVDFDDGATTTDVQSNASTANGVQTYEFGGSTHDLMHEGSFTTFDSLGYDFSFPTSVDGTTRRWLSVSIEAAAAASSALLLLDS